jgi:hypothetical protein
MTRTILDDIRVNAAERETRLDVVIFVLAKIPPVKDECYVVLIHRTARMLSHPIGRDILSCLANWTW